MKTSLALTHTLKRLLKRHTYATCLLVLSLLLALLAWFACPPPLQEAERYPAGAILRDARGAILRVGLGPGDVDCRPVYAAATNDSIVQALIAAEDHRFFRHHGVDPLALLRAMRQNVTSGRRISGASTLTMQSIRLIKPRRRTWRSKFIETVQALRLERALSKTEILSQYLNRAPFGSNLVGIEAAAWGWFNRAPQALSLGEAALLAGMVQSPTRFRPDRNLAAALKRRTYVLQQMERSGMISIEQRQLADRQPVSLSRAPRPFREPWFCDWAQRHERVYAGERTTTLDPALQHRVSEALEAHALRQACSVAAVVIEVATGNVTAMAVSGDYFDPRAGQVNTATTPHPAGSTLKPFVYAQAIDQGRLTPAWVLADVPRHYGNQAPVNFSGAFQGLVSAEDALVLSLNLPAIALAEQVGLPRFWSLLQKLGFTSLNRSAQFYGLGLVLGNGSVSLLELANAAACLARSGIWQPCRAFSESSVAVDERRVFSPGACWMVAEMLSGDARARDAVGHVAEVKLPRFAWKTGTSAGFRDAWTVAWNPAWVVAVWCGDKHGGRGPETRVGKQAAAPLAWELVRALYPTGNGPWYARPDAVIDRRVCAVSGRVAGELCSETRSDVAIRECSSWEICPVHVRNAAGAIEAHWPSDVTAGLSLIASSTAEASVRPAGTPLTILTPAAGTRYRLVEGLADQRVVFTVSGAQASEPLYWFQGDHFIGTTLAPAPLFWTPERGQQRFVVSSESGAADEVEFVVE